ncbi:HigA family addiction module antitoxin [endosymbiont GvMRE of Glomus versiforme]|uniref:HigA family addiction module antitoxin n=1 Tax=endosymbiont GvMRE of Glomus versiforme TaxID=2039283 RepID=UPI000ED02A45|nr:HigA family addiction module antitoxin [endosymbiont GvMRE of Glomus versiforme]RHZ37570.1 Addiction module antidote protein, HigA family [endosymbiont GvMRE of Glomus versiforme]
MKSKKLPPIHPGTILSKEFLIPRKISQTKLATSINVPVKLVKEICQAKKSINAEMALRLGTYFGTSAELWLGLQQDYEQECLEDILKNQQQQIKKEIRPFLHSKATTRLRKHA